MIITEHASDLAGATRRPVTPLEQDSRRRVQVAAVEKLHLTVNDRTLCGLVTVDQLDVYSDEAGLRAWNTGPLEQCAQCAGRAPGTDSPIDADRPPCVRPPSRTRRAPRAGAARPADPRAESLMERDGRSIDDQVLAALRAPTLSGMSAVMNPKLISHHIGLIAGTGWGPSPQAVTAALKRLAQAGLVQRAGRSRTCWTVTR